MQPVSREPRCLTLLKGGERFCFSYAEGRDSELLATFVGLAADPKSKFDWFDAAALSFQMGRLAAWDHCRAKSLSST